MTLGNMKRVVVLFQLGGPDSIQAVEPFLYNLFRDPCIIDLPGAFLFRNMLARLISRSRAPKVIELYNKIGGKSPILDETLAQATCLRKELAARGTALDVHVAMRYWHPLTEEAVRKLLACDVDEAILLPLYPHFSRATTGSSLREWRRVIRRLGLQDCKTEIVESYHDHLLYIDALVERVVESLEKLPAEQRAKVHLVFSAHGTPLKLVRQGDPYSRQIRRTYELVVERGSFGLSHHLCFQSKVGPLKWLEPSLIQTIEDLARKNVSHIVVIPISFVSEHIETLSEINIEAREEATRLGIEYFDMTQALSTSGKFIAALTDLVLKKVYP